MVRTATRALDDLATYAAEFPNSTDTDLAMRERATPDMARCSKLLNCCASPRLCRKARQPRNVTVWTDAACDLFFCRNPTSDDEGVIR